MTVHPPPTKIYPLLATKTSPERIQLRRGIHLAVWTQNRRPSQNHVGFGTKEYIKGGIYLGGGSLPTLTHEIFYEGKEKIENMTNVLLRAEFLSDSIKKNQESLCLGPQVFKIIHM